MAKKLHFRKEHVMANTRHHWTWISCVSLRAGAIGLALASMFVLTVVATQQAHAQTFSVVHNFTGADGADPLAGLTIDRGGNLYGTTYRGGSTGLGTVYMLAHNGSGWNFNSLYSFAGGNDGAKPYGRVIFGRNGTLYGTTSQGGNSSCSGGCGTVFNLKPVPASVVCAGLCPWTETALYRFTGTNGAGPSGDLVFDQAGNLYGTTYVGGGMGGPDGAGVVYKLTAAGVESTLYTFPETGCTAGADPFGGVIFDNTGNLYGTTRSTGAYGCGNGVVFQLSPSGSGWIENVLYTFQNGTDGGLPHAGLISDQTGKLYGATSSGGQGGGGTVFQMTPPGSSWTFNTLYGFTGSGGPQGNLIMDQSGNLYGTTVSDGAHGFGSVFKLTLSGAGTWTYTSLYDFTGGSDGANPYSNLVFDASGNLYGTASAGGTGSACSGDCGVVFEITP
jgi:uncharacterized repeat protein (TIGR03803 family)